MVAAETKRGVPSPIEQAREFFKPENMGFEARGSGWEKYIPGVGPVVFMPLSWEHKSINTSLNETTQGSVLDLVSQIHQEVFQMTDRAAAAPIHLGNIAKRGGSVIIAFKKDETGPIKPTYQNWLGFGIVEGSNHEKAVSEFIGIHKDFRDKGIAAELRYVQMFKALEADKPEFELEMGPLRGKMANLSIRKLGGIVTEFIPAKYPGMDYKLYGPETEDRIKVVYNLLDPRVQNKMRNLALGRKSDEIYPPQHGTQIPLVTKTNVHQEISRGADQIRYRIPEDADTLDAEEKSEWREDMVEVFESLLTHEKVYKPNDDSTDVTEIGTTTTHRSYAITDFIRVNGENFYIFTRKDRINSMRLGRLRSMLTLTN